MDEFARRTEQIERQFALLAAAPAPVPGDAQRGVAPSVGAPAAAAVSEDPDAPTDVQKLNYRIMHLLRTCDAKDAQLQSKDDEIAKLNYRILTLTRALDKRDPLPIVPK